MVKDLAMSVVIESVGETQVFVNENGSITMTQEIWCEEQAMIVIPLMFIDSIIEALKSAKQEAMEINE